MTGSPLDPEAVHNRASPCGSSPCDIEDVSTCNWRTLGVDPEWTSDEPWCTEQARKTFRKDFLDVCKKPHTKNLFGVEFIQTKQKRVEIPLVDWLDTLDMTEEVKHSLMALLSKSTCQYAHALRLVLAELYSSGMENERPTLG